MTLYIIAAILTALVVVVLLHPLLRARVEETSSEAEEVLVYKAQLADIDRDLAAGILAADEVEQTRREIQRRILAADEKRRAKPHSGRPAKRLALMLLIILPLAGPGLYLVLGQPEAPSQPHAKRQDVAMQRVLQERAMEIRETLAAAPNDPEGWQELAMLRSMLGQTRAAVDAYRMAIAQGAEEASVYAAYAEALIRQAEGRVTQEAREALGAAIERDEAEPLALYYIGHALEQDERYEMALRLWGDMAEALPEGSQWQLRLQEDIARIHSKMQAGE